MDSDILHRAKNAALAILARRDNSVKEMKMKLRKKEISEDAITDTIAWLKQKRLLDDSEFAKKKAESIYRTKLVGPSYIKMKLRAVGIADDMAGEVVDNLASDEEWNSRAKQALTQWKKIHPKHAQDRIRHMRFLASRGFDNSLLPNWGEG